MNYIYRNTKFDGRYEHRNIRFEVNFNLFLIAKNQQSTRNNDHFIHLRQVQRIKIDDDSACSPQFKGDSNPFCMENIDVSNFLNLHSLGDHQDFCLAYVFTYRDFTGGTLGLAWVASASGKFRAPTIPKYCSKAHGI